MGIMSMSIMYLEMGLSKFPQHELPNLIVRIILGRVVTEILIRSCCSE